LIRGLYISASGMTAQELNQNRVTNNLANANTVGFKKDVHVFRTFQEVLLERVNRLPSGNRERNVIGITNQGTMVDETRTDYSDGLLQETGKPLDMAIIGQGMFTVETPQGLRFTRDGSFQLNSEGYLVTATGDYVLGYQGPINLADEVVHLTPEGELVAEDGWVIDQLLIADFEDWERLTKAGDNYFVVPDDINLMPAQDITLKPGFLEKANINLVEEIVDLITVTRIYEANQKAIQAQDEILGKSVNELGALR
jgi:flagellar basal-body rod protein FlgF